MSTFKGMGPGTIGKKEHLQISDSKENCCREKGGLKYVIYIKVLTCVHTYSTWAHYQLVLVST